MNLSRTRCWAGVTKQKKSAWKLSLLCTNIYCKIPSPRSIVRHFQYLGWKNDGLETSQYIEYFSSQFLGQVLKKSWLAKIWFIPNSNLPPGKLLDFGKNLNFCGSFSSSSSTVANWWNKIGLCHFNNWCGFVFISTKTEDFKLPRELFESFGVTSS